MRQTKWPRLCERWRGNMAVRVGCNDCGKTWVASVDDVIRADHGCLSCVFCGSLKTCAAYHEGVRCPGCRKLHWGHDLRTWRYGSCCSRRCWLIAEYAKFLWFRLLMEADAPWRGYSCG